MTFFLMVGAVGMSFSPLGRAFARRIGGEHGPDVKALQEDVESLRQELADVRSELAVQIDEAHNRLDFAERMLAQAKQAPALPDGKA